MPCDTGNPQGNTGYISELDVRIFLRDLDPEANLLIKDLEFGTEEIRTAVTLAVDFWNEEPPNFTRANYTVDTFPFRYHLLMGTAANLLFIAAHLYRRNKLSYNVPGGAVNDQAKDNDYEQAGARLWQQYIEWVRRKKRELNIMRGWANV